MQDRELVAVVVFELAARQVQRIARLLIDAFMLRSALNTGAVLSEGDQILVDREDIGDLLRLAEGVRPRNIGFAVLIFLGDALAPHQLQKAPVGVGIDHDGLAGARAIEMDFPRLRRRGGERESNQRREPRPFSEARHFRSSN